MASDPQRCPGAGEPSDDDTEARTRESGDTPSLRGSLYGLGSARRRPGVGPCRGGVVGEQWGLGPERHRKSSTTIVQSL